MSLCLPRLQLDVNEPFDFKENGQWRNQLKKSPEKNIRKNNASEIYLEDMLLLQVVEPPCTEICNYNIDYFRLHIGQINAN
jgi:hypothetical protein